MKGKITKLYDICCHEPHEEHMHEHTSLADELPIDLDGTVRNALRKIYDREVNAGQVYNPLHLKTALTLWEGLQEGFGKKLDSIDRADLDREFMTQLRTNVYIFSAFKNHHFVLDVIDQLTDGNGNIRSFSKFKEIVQGISDNYNKNWLLAEYDTAIGTGQMARKWKEIERDSDILPFLRYDTVGDGRVRPDHKILEGVTLRYDDPFWDVYYPPNGWRCRCSVQQVTGPQKSPDDTPEVPKAFRHNAGKTGQLYTRDHPYYTVRRGFKKDAENNFGATIK